MPQRGYGLQPRVAASATLGASKKEISTATRLRRFLRKENAQSRRNRVAVEGKIVFFTQGCQSATLGWNWRTLSALFTPDNNLQSTFGR